MTKSQVKMMGRMVAEGTQVPPGGMGRRTAAAASAWWRVVEALVAKGYATCRCVQGGGWAKVTDAGRAAYSNHNARRMTAGN